MDRQIVHSAFESIFVDDKIIQWTLYILAHVRSSIPTTSTIVSPGNCRHHAKSIRSQNAVTITAENPTQTADRRVLSYSPLPTPTEILGELPLGEAREALVERKIGRAHV